MRLYSPLLGLICLSLLSSCGFTDAGSGSETMRLNLAVSYKFGGSNLSLCTATINSPSGLPVEGAVVTLHKGGEDAALVTLTEAETEAGSYTGSFSDYHQDLTLKVTSPQDGELEASLSGPTRHLIVSPRHSSTIERSDLGSGLTVTWDSEFGLRADEVVLRVPEKTVGFGEDDDELENYVYQSGATDDTGSGTIPSERLTVPDSTSTGSTSTESVQVLRRNTVKLAGGYTGSLFTIAYIVENNIEITN